MFQTRPNVSIYEPATNSSRQLQPVILNEYCFIAMCSKEVAGPKKKKRKS